MYTGALENHPDLIDAIAAERPLWGNPGQVLRQVRQPMNVLKVLRDHGLPCPAVRLEPPESTDDRSWLVKPLHGAGGHGVRFWNPRQPHSSDVFYQEWIDGEAVSSFHFATDQATHCIGVSRQLVGLAWLHARPFRYCGSIGPLPLPQDTLAKFACLGEVLWKSFNLRGFFGIDAILRDGEIWLVEINPRFTASAEIYHRSLKQSLFDVSAIDPVFTPGFWGKAIWFAPHDCIFPAEGPWLSTLRQPLSVTEYDFADIPRAGTSINKGQPILTFFTQGASIDACLWQLRQSAVDLDRCLLQG
jgi:predicted ATP-grasp superfamily ATP-dependent carboligase